jgi:cysteine desulfurase/selenocysteine lyase
LGIPGTIRASFAFYNNTEDIDRLVAALNRTLPMLR